MKILQSYNMEGLITIRLDLTKLVSCADQEIMFRSSGSLYLDRMMVIKLQEIASGIASTSCIHPQSRSEQFGFRPIRWSIAYLHQYKIAKLLNLFSSSRTVQYPSPDTQLLHSTKPLHQPNPNPNLLLPAVNPSIHRIPSSIAKPKLRLTEHWTSPFSPILAGKSTSKHTQHPP